MKYKILFGIVMIMLMAGLVTAEEDYHAYNESQFGNVHIQVGTSSADPVGTANNNTICIPTTAPMDGYVTSFIMSGSSTYAMRYCVNTERQLPQSSCNSNVFGYFGFSSQENVSTYLNYLFSEGEDMYFCFQEPDNIGTNNLDTWQTNSYSWENKNNTWHSFSSDDNSDLKQYKYSGSEDFFGYWYYTISGGWVERNEYPEEFQFCMNGVSGEVCYALGSKAYSRYLQCGGLNQKAGEQFLWTGDTVEFNTINLWLYAGTGLTSTAKFKIGVDEFNIATNVSTNLWLGAEHNFDEINGSNLYRYVTEIIPFTNVTFVNGNTYRVYYTCFQGCGSGIYSVCSAQTREETADSYSFYGFQGDTGKLFIDTAGTPVYYDHIDMNFLMTSGSGEVWSVSTPSNITNCSTTCTTWSGSTYLKEDFNGDLNQCDWAVNREVCWSSQILMDKTDDYYTIFKLSDLKYSTDSRYFTLSFDIRPADIEPDGYISISLYDEDYTKYVNVLFGDDDKFYNNEDGNAVEKYSNMSSGLTKNMQLHVDLTSDDFDVYYDGSKILSGMSFVNSFYNIDNIYGLRLSSQNAGYIIENLEIYATNQNNVRTVVDEEENPETPDENKAWCELFTRTDETCSVDADCDTGECLVNGKCSHFDFTYCDENGHIRGNKCIFAGMTSCVLTSTGDLILDNFFLFLILLVIIMGLVYLTIMLSR